MLRSIATAIFAAGIAAISLPASAGVIFNMTGSCTAGFFCGSTGPAGHPISGFVEFDDGFDLAAIGTFHIPIDYHLEFGNVIMDPDDGDTSTFLRSGHDTFEKTGINDIGPGSFKVWSTSQNIALIFIGQCCGANPLTDHWVYGFSPGSSGPYFFTREDPLVVSAPEPGLAPALVVGLLATAGRILRRRSRAVK